MTEITLLSGKGGTGKTTITAALASLMPNAIFCDADVDAADLFLILTPQILETLKFESGFKAQINQEKCTKCGLCKKLCRFGAIHYQAESGFEINPFQCEGCKLCERQCPANAITSYIENNNFWYISDTRFGKMVHARMAPGEENSGKLVTTVRQKAKEIAQNTNADYLLTDGPPGIGCSAISALSGTDKVLLVIEPTNSGFHDIKRLIQLIQKFDIKTYAIINKFDINTKISAEIEQELTLQNIKLIGKVPFDNQFVNAMINQQTIVEFSPESKITKELKTILQKITT